MPDRRERLAVRPLSNRSWTLGSKPASAPARGANLAREPRRALSVATEDFDLAVEGEGHQVTDPATVAARAQLWAAEGWPARVDETGRAITAEYSAPAAGPPPWFVYRLTPRPATALAPVEPGGATRWR